MKKAPSRPTSKLSKKPTKTFTRVVSHLEESLLPLLEANFPSPQKDYKPFKQNNMEIDFAWPDLKIGIEVNGGLYLKRGGHTSPTGVRRDYYKLNLAQLQGWILLQFPPEYCKEPYWSGMAFPMLRKAFKLREKP